MIRFPYSNFSKVKERIKYSRRLCTTWKLECHASFFLFEKKYLRELGTGEYTGSKVIVCFFWCLFTTYLILFTPLKTRWCVRFPGVLNRLMVGELSLRCIASFFSSSSFIVSICIFSFSSLVHILITCLKNSDKKRVKWRFVPKSNWDKTKDFKTILELDSHKIVLTSTWKSSNLQMKVKTL